MIDSNLSQCIDSSANTRYSNSSAKQTGNTHQYNKRHSTNQTKLFEFFECSTTNVAKNTTVNYITSNTPNVEIMWQSEKTVDCDQEFASYSMDTSINPNDPPTTLAAQDVEKIAMKIWRSGEILLSYMQQRQSFPDQSDIQLSNELKQSIVNSGCLQNLPFDDGHPWSSSTVNVEKFNITSYRIGYFGKKKLNVEECDLRVTISKHYFKKNVASLEIRRKCCEKEFDYKFVK